MATHPPCAKFAQVALPGTNRDRKKMRLSDLLVVNKRIGRRSISDVCGRNVCESQDVETCANCILILAVTLFQNVGIFDGKSAALSASANVPVRGELGWIP